MMKLAGIKTVYLAWQVEKQKKNTISKTEIVKKQMALFTFVAVALIALFLHPVHAQAPEPQNGEAAGETVPADGQNGDSVFRTLGLILESMETVQNSIESAEDDLNAAKTEDLKKESEEALDGLHDQLKSLEWDFVKISTGIDPESMREQPKVKVDLQTELEQLAKPVIDELKELTEAPRKIDELREKVAFNSNNLEKIEKGLKNIRSIIPKNTDEKLGTHLSEIEQHWADMAKQAKNALAVAEHELNEKLKEKKTFLESTQDFFKRFFKSRGRNLGLAIFSFVFVIIAMRMLRRVIFKSVPEGRDRPFYFRVIDVSYHLLTFLFAYAALVAIFYISGDWFLLSISVIFLLGVAWAAKQGIPKYLEQIKFMLNLGTVKENERIIYHGVPWRVASLNMTSRLENPALSTNQIVLPLKYLFDYASRPSHPSEPWFPTEVDDWVLLGDGTRGQVILQSPEVVIIERPGGTPKTYVTSDYLGLTPFNLSKGFRVKVIFGIDYAHQADCTTDVIDKLKGFLHEKLKGERYDETFLNLRVEFNSAGASSLDYAVMAFFSGNAARGYGVLTRTIQRWCVEACNKYGWGIPFTTLTVHTVQPESDGPALPTETTAEAP